MTTELVCLDMVPGCTDCEAEASHRLVDRLGDHDCDDLCRWSGQAKRDDPEFHRLTHQPQTREGCAALIDDKRGNDRTVIKWCPEGSCRLWCCPDCGEDYASDGPVGCPSCFPIEEGEASAR